MASMLGPALKIRKHLSALFKLQSAMLLQVFTHLPSLYGFRKEAIKATLDASSSSFSSKRTNIFGPLILDARALLSPDREQCESSATLCLLLCVVYTTHCFRCFGFVVAPPTATRVRLSRHEDDDERDNFRQSPLLERDPKRTHFPLPKWFLSCPSFDCPSSKKREEEGQ